MRVLYVIAFCIVFFVGCIEFSTDNGTPPDTRMYGLDYIGGARYTQAILDAHPSGVAAGFLWEVDGFGSAAGTINSLAATGKAPVIRVHLLWKDNHTFKSTDRDEAILRCREIVGTVVRYPNIHWYVSPWLEPEHFWREDYETTLRRCREILPERVQLVASSLQGFDFIGVVTEMHHEGWKDVPGQTLFSFDGMDSTEHNIPYYESAAHAAEVFFLWNHSLNGKAGPGDARKRSERTNYASKEDILELYNLL